MQLRVIAIGIIESFFVGLLYRGRHDLAGINLSIGDQAMAILRLRDVRTTPGSMRDHARLYIGERALHFGHATRICASHGAASLSWAHDVTSSCRYRSPITRYRCIASETWRAPLSIGARLPSCGLAGGHDGQGKERQKIENGEKKQKHEQKCEKRKW